MQGSDPAPKDPREVLRENRELDPDSVLVGGDYQILLRAIIQRGARRYNVDPEELRQEFEVSMLRRSATVDEGNPGVASWLWRRVTWTARDMLRRQGREIPIDPAQFPADDLRPGEQVVGDVPLAELLRVARRDFWRLGLTPNEAQTVALLCSGVDMPLNVFAKHVGRSHDCVRKERSRGLSKIKTLFGLTREEDEVLQAWRTYGSARAAAPHLHQSEDEINRIVDDAHKKIDRIFGEKEV